jgi:hypothetical protein
VSTTNANRQWWIFVAALALASAVPYIVMPLNVIRGADVQTLALVAAVVNFLGGTAHVGSTGFFLFDGRMRRYFLGHPIRFFVAPLAIMAFYGMIFGYADQQSKAFALLIHFIWQTYHYQRQNFGILSFGVAREGGRPVSRLERYALNISVIAAILALTKHYNLLQGTIFADQQALLYQAGLWLYLSVPLLLIYLFATEKALRRISIRPVFLVLGCAFYIPSFLFDDPSAAVLGYALAHGLQYLIFMVVVSKKAFTVSLRGLVLMGLSAGVLGWVLAKSSSAETFLSGPLAGGVFGVYLGGVMTHFLYDAGIWRLREAFQRGYMREAFWFIFDPDRAHRRAAE